MKHARGACSECGSVGEVVRGMCRSHYERARRAGRLQAVRGLSVEQAFRARVTVLGADECWPWTGYRDGRGYGLLWTGSRGDGTRRTLMATHLALRVFSGIEVPPGNKACHRCDNPPCCNPAHLFVGTHDDNMQDMRSKGRAPKVNNHGARNPNAKLTPAQVEEIVRRRRSGEQRRRLAAEFGVGEGHIYNIVRGHAWREQERPREEETPA